MEKFLNAEEINNLYEKIMEEEKIDGNSYWKALILGTIINCGIEVNVTEQDFEDMANEILNDDILWQEIDNTVMDIVEKYREEYGYAINK